VAIHINQADWPSQSLPDAQQSAKHDAAISAKDDDKPFKPGGHRDALAKRPAVCRDFMLIPRTARWPNVVAIRRRHHVAQVGRTQTLDNVTLSKSFRGAIELPGFAGVIGPDADAG
jgi:hypothetical protein